MSFKQLQSRQFILFLSLCVTSEGLVLSPSRDAMVCEGGELSLSCSTNVSLLSWTTSPLQNDQRQVLIFKRSISSVGASQQASDMMVNSTFFNVSRVSDQDELPLVSRLVINPVSVDLNGTKVNCTERAMNNKNTAVASTTVYVLGEHSNSQKVITSVKYGTENITVTLECVPSTNTSYIVSVETPYILESSLSSARLIGLPYNTHLNVSIMARWCGIYTITTIIQLHYVKCDYPMLNDSQSIQVMGNVNPALEGTTINFSCPAGLTLTGPNTSTCLGNGEWELDPMESNIRCLANCGPLLLPLNGYTIINSNDTLEGSSTTFVCLTALSAVVYTSICDQAGFWEPLPTDICQLATVDKASTITLTAVSSTCVFIFTSILFFLFGYVCGFRQKCRKQIAANVNPIHENTMPGHMHAEITTEQVDSVDLTKNEAYDLLNIGTSHHGH